MGSVPESQDSGALPMLAQPRLGRPRLGCANMGSAPEFLRKGAVPIGQASKTFEKNVRKTNAFCSVRKQNLQKPKENQCVLVSQKAKPLTTKGKRNVFWSARKQRLAKNTRKTKVFWSARKQNLQKPKEKQCSLV